MTAHGTPSPGSAAACPFVAFDEDRDERATHPDHRHRCYAEVRPAPRALAHQEAYCLSSTFAVCPTFQDWARREAARATAEPEGAGVEEDGPPPASASGQPLRNPHREWTAPPPWLADEGSAGLSGSMADRLAAGGTIPGPEPHAPPPEEATERPLVVPRTAARRVDEIHSADPLAIPEPPRRQTRDVGAPSWERPRRMEAYPVIRSRLGLPSISVSPLVLGVVALFLAAVGLFMLPGFLGLGGPDAPGPTATPGASAEPSGAASTEPSPDVSAEPTLAPGPTPTIYIVKSGDSLSEIAQRFGVKLPDLIAANPQITDPNRIDVGDEIVIPSAGPTAIPDAGTPSPGVSAVP